MTFTYKLCNGTRTETIPMIPTTPTTYAGDVDADGSINLKDAVVIQRYIAGGWGVALDIDSADVNKDGEVNLKDAVLIRRYLARGWGVRLS